MSTEPRVVVIVGRTGRGKSALGNVLEGAKIGHFKEGAPNQITSETSSATCVEITYDGQVYRIVDTMGFFDTELATNESFEKIIRQVAEKASSGVDAFLICFRGDDTFTKQDHDVFVAAKNILGEEFTQHAILVWTRGGGLEEKVIEEGKAGLHLPGVLKELGDRHVASEAKATISMVEDTSTVISEADNQRDSRERVFCKISEFVGSKGGRYAPEKFQRVLQQVRELKILVECISKDRRLAAEETVKSVKSFCDGQLDHDAASENLKQLFEQDQNEKSQLRREKDELEKGKLDLENALAGSNSDVAALKTDVANLRRAETQLQADMARLQAAEQAERDTASRLKAQFRCIMRGALAGFLVGMALGALSAVAAMEQKLMPWMPEGFAVPPILFALSGATVVAAVTACTFRCREDVRGRTSGGEAVGVPLPPRGAAAGGAAGGEATNPFLADLEC